MLTFSEVVGNMLDAWPFWVFIGAFVLFWRRIAKSNGGGSYYDFASRHNNDLDAQYRGVPGSNGVVSILSHRGLNLMNSDD